MSDKYLVVNAGSSSLKFSLYEMPSKEIIASGSFEKVGYKDSLWTMKTKDNKIKENKFFAKHSDAVVVLLNELLNNNIIESLTEIKGVGHRILHGGEIYSDSVLIDDEALEHIKNLTVLGPLHHPAQIACIEAIKEYLPIVANVAVFDTAFHQTMPKEKYMYAIPLELYEKNGVRKYGFHGTSHKYINKYMKETYGKENPNLIICHLGNGASITAIKEGKSYNTSMGLTPLDGLIMGTRSGSIDPSIIGYVSNNLNKTAEEVIDILNKKSGLLGIIGQNDFRDIIPLVEKGDKNAVLGYNMYIDSVVKYIAQYYFELDGRVDAIVFTAGVGENCIEVRRDVTNRISNSMNLKLDVEKNNNIYKTKCGLITTPESKTAVLVIPTDEEEMILMDTYDITNKIDMVKTHIKNRF